jgi:hypothetical protein
LALFQSHSECSLSIKNQTTIYLPVFITSPGDCSNKKIGGSPFPLPMITYSPARNALKDTALPWAAPISNQRFAFCASSSAANVV